jgi:hypothetical protein
MVANANNQTNERTTNGNDPCELLISWLNDACAMEQTLVSALENHAKDAEKERRGRTGDGALAGRAVAPNRDHSAAHLRRRPAGLIRNHRGGAEGAEAGNPGSSSLASSAHCGAESLCSPLRLDTTKTGRKKRGLSFGGIGRWTSWREGNCSPTRGLPNTVNRPRATWHWEMTLIASNDRNGMDCQAPLLCVLGASAPSHGFGDGLISH